MLRASGPARSWKVSVNFSNLQVGGRICIELELLPSDRVCAPGYISPSALVEVIG